MSKIYPLRNPVQYYSWGSKSAIQSLVKDLAHPEKPVAELWMGAHPKGTSEVFYNQKWQPLDRVIADNPSSILGKDVAETFHNTLPFLFKVLAAERPLSIQVHPDRGQAVKGYETENQKYIPFDATHRTYRDQNHKPEILCAVTEFEGLKGFRDIREALALMQRLGLDSLAPEINDLQNRPDSEGLESFFSALLCMEKSKLKRVIQEALTSAQKIKAWDPACAWIIKLHEEYGDDPGVLSPVILNLVILSPGEAVYLPPGELHAYLKGVGMELMANSDNVLRGGLTPKHVDIAELLNVVQFKNRPVEMVMPVREDDCLTVYNTPAKEFRLSKIRVLENHGYTRITNHRPEIIICLQGSANIRIDSRDQPLHVNKGGSFLIPADVPSWHISGNAVFYTASVPAGNDM